MRTIKTLLLLSLSTILFSCNKDDCDHYPDKSQTVAIQKVEATTQIDLSKYKNWYCVVGGERASGGFAYNHELKDNKLIVTPKSAEKTYYATNNMKYENGNTIPSLTLYWLPKERVNESRDQSTFEKMLLRDVLRWFNFDTSSPTITGATLIHDNSMVRFTTENLPENARVRIITHRGNGPIILPFIKNGAYHFIDVFAISARVFVSIGDKEYEIDISENENNIVYGGPNAFYTFILNYDANAENGKVLSVKNLHSTTWYNQHFEL